MKRWIGNLTLLLAFALIGLNQASVRAEEQGGMPFLHPLFSEGMVLQRDIAAPVWGWTTPGKTVTVSMEGKSAKATANAEGKWMAKIGPFPAGGPYTLTVKGPQEIVLRNVLVGDVWVCSGQSNMEFGIGNGNNAQDEIAHADYPNIRLFTVPKKIATEPEALVSASWQVCTPQSVSTGGWGGFSAVGYFFGRDLYEKTHIPIGLIHTSWGGTVAEAWTSHQALSRLEDFKPALAQFDEMAKMQKQGNADFGKQLAEWYRKNDPGSRTEVGWADPNADTVGWKSMKLPSAWEQAGLPDYDGIVWFRLEVNLPQNWDGKEAVLHLGPIDDNDTAWINGVKVGATEGYLADRNYKVPVNVLKSGKNVIAVRVLDTGGAGGLYGKPEQMRLEMTGAAQVASVSLAGDWQYKDSVPLARATPVPMPLTNNPNITTVLYNGMIAPLLPFAIKGAIWYQGESNADRAYEYRSLLPAMIRDWRSRFGVAEFPFFIVQLANFTAVQPNPGDSDWAELREAQAMTAKEVGHSAIAVTTDIGDVADIHPKDKQDVGKRLALDALALVYGQKVEYAGPTYASMKTSGSAIRIAFSHIGGGLVAKGDKLIGFAIAGEDRKWRWADAKIEGDSVVVSSPEVSAPVAVRYGWATSPVVNLYNKAGLPAPPFRTDDWPGVTVGRK